MSGFYIGVDGKARKVKGAYVGVDGIARKMKKGYVGVNGVARLCWSFGKKLSEYTVGSSVYLNENGSPVEYLIVHQGLPSSVYDSSCDGVWLLRKDCYSEMAYHTSSNNYSTSTIHTYLNDTFIKRFNTKVQSIVKQVKIPYSSGSSIVSGVNGLSTKAFLLGSYEVGFTTSQNTAIPIDGAKLDYFETGTSSSANTKRIAYLNGNAVYWWTRSSHKTNSQYVWDVSTTGTSGGEFVYNNDAIRPALILPYDVLVNDNSIIIG